MVTVVFWLALASKNAGEVLNGAKALEGVPPMLPGMHPDGPGNAQFEKTITIRLSVSNVSGVAPAR